VTEVIFMPITYHKSTGGFVVTLTLYRLFVANFNVFWLVSNRCPSTLNAIGSPLSISLKCILLKIKYSLISILALKRFFFAICTLVFKIIPVRIFIRQISWESLILSRVLNKITYLESGLVNYLLF